MQLKGIIHIPEKAINKKGVFYIRVQDTSVMDMPAETMVEIVLDQKPGLSKMAFSFELPKTLKTTANYTLFVHLDLDGDKHLSEGDWLHNRAYQVIIRGATVDKLEVSLMEIG